MTTFIEAKLKNSKFRQTYINKYRVTEHMILKQKSFKYVLDILITGYLISTY